MDCASGAKKSVFRETARRIDQKSARCGAQQRDIRATVTLKPECRRAPGCVKPAVGFGLDDRGPSNIGDLRAEAGSRNASSHDQDVEFSHFSGAGYGLESPAV